MNVRDDDFRTVARLWRESAEFAAGESEAALQQCMRGLIDLLGGIDAFWVGAVRERGHPPDDVFRGWRPRAIKYLRFNEERERGLTRILRELHADQIDPLTKANLGLAGTTRAVLRSELVSDEVWRASWLYKEVLKPQGIEDRLMGTYTVDAERESYIGIDRGPDDPPFAERERDLLAVFLTGTPALHRQLFRSHGLLDAKSALSPRERDVLRLLLSDRTERVIAEELGLAESTVRQYVVSVLAAFGVKRRVGLMARWLAPACLANPSDSKE